MKRAGSKIARDIEEDFARQKEILEEAKKRRSKKEKK